MNVPLPTFEQQPFHLIVGLRLGDAVGAEPQAAPAAAARRPPPRLPPRRFQALLHIGPARCCIIVTTFVVTYLSYEAGRAWQILLATS